MRAKNKKVLAVLVAMIGSIFLVNCLISTETPESNVYLTPIPKSTWEAYREKRPLNTKYDAVLEATQYIYYSRMTFTQSPPRVVFAEEMTLVDAKNLIPKDPGEVYSYEDRPDDTKVWLVIFEGSWQIAPPDGDLLPLESGCIYTIIDANQMSHNQGRTAKCQPVP